MTPCFAPVPLTSSSGALRRAISWSPPSCVSFWLVNSRFVPQVTCVFLSLLGPSASSIGWQGTFERARALCFSFYLSLALFTRHALRRAAAALATWLQPQSAKSRDVLCWIRVPPACRQCCSTSRECIRQPCAARTASARPLPQCLPISTAYVIPASFAPCAFRDGGRSQCVCVCLPR